MFSFIFLLVHDGCKSKRRGRLVLLTVPAALAVSGTLRCSDYPLAPTFCDDWCRVLLRANCDLEPENCVRVCERSQGPAACDPLQRELLACYEGAPNGSFVCSASGFTQLPRPREETCRSERDALIDCAYPKVRACLSVCRSFEERLRSDAGALDAGSRYCPSDDVPCDSICWLAAPFVDDVIASGGDAHSSSFEEVTGDLLTCALRRSNECRASLEGGIVDAGAIDADRPDGRAAPANWASVLFGCADELIERRGL